MLVRQSKNTFIRCTDNYGYITNQLTYHDRSYDDIGADFLKEINRKPQNVDDIVERLYKNYFDVDIVTLKADFIDFIIDLVDSKFLVVGDSEEEIDKKDIDFSYKLENPKTLAYDFTQNTNQEINENTQDFMLEEVQKEPRLIGLQFELTSKCNERCIHCYIPNNKKDSGKSMPLNKVLSIIDEFSMMGGLHITLSGGEVLLHKDFMKILQYCRNKDMKISILSNLIALEDNMIPKIKEANISLIQVSLYSMNPDVHDKITTVKGSYIKTISAIEKLVSADIPLQISCPIMKENFRDYKDVLKFAKSLRIKAQSDFIMMAQSDLNKENLNNRISIQETEYLLRDIMEFNSHYKDEILNQKPVSESIEFDFERFSKQPVCGVGQNDCCITENGDIYPCAGWQAYVLGNIYEKPLKDIWENSEKIKILRKVTQASFPQCLKCEARDFCAMCLVRNFNENDGDMFKINEHFCKVAFLNKKIVEEYYNYKK